MKTCKKGHIEITYDETENPSCPMCDLLEQNSTLLSVVEITGNILKELRQRYYEAACLNNK